MFVDMFLFCGGKFSFTDLSLKKIKLTISILSVPTSTYLADLLNIDNISFQQMMIKSLSLTFLTLDLPADLANICFYHDGS